MNKCINCPIAHCTAFSGVEEPVLASLEKEKIRQKYKKKDLLFKEGEEVEGIHCLFKGRVKVFQKDRQGKKHIIAICQPGDLLGLVGLYNPGTYRVSGEAIDEVETCLISKNSILPALQKSAVFLRNILSELAGNVNRMVTTLGEQRQISVRERIAKTLLALSESRVPKEPSCTPPAIKMSRTDIASFSGTVLESAVRCLTEFKKEGLIQISGKEIQLINPTLLRKLATNSR